MLESTLKISIADRNDISDLCALLDTLFSQESEFTPNRNRQIKGLINIIENPSIGNIVVAREGDQLIGMVNLLYTVSTALGGRVILLEDMVVDPNSQNKGVGSALLEFGIEIAKQKGCLRITLLTDADNESAHRFYEKHGFDRSSMTVFRKILI